MKKITKRRFEALLRKYKILNYWKNKPYLCATVAVLSLIILGMLFKKPDTVSAFADLCMAGAAIFAAYHAKDWFHTERIKFKFNLLLKLLDDIIFLVNEFETITTKLESLKNGGIVSIEKLNDDISKLNKSSKLILSDLHKLSIFNEEIGTRLLDLIMCIQTRHIHMLEDLTGSNKKEPKYFLEAHNLRNEIVFAYIDFKKEVYEKINQLSKM
ncbi:hypothetical protein WCU73_02460 [Pectobacterium brasiliense]|uniref:hypothetical protein n=1 Tax=Pectobacterium brasiliense TaxID=180957 RepID=UPI0030169962